MYLYRCIKFADLGHLRNGVRLARASTYQKGEGPETDPNDSLLTFLGRLREREYVRRLRKYWGQAGMGPFRFLGDHKRSQNIFVSCWTSAITHKLIQSFCDTPIVVIAARSEALIDGFGRCCPPHLHFHHRKVEYFDTKQDLSKWHKTPATSEAFDENRAHLFATQHHQELMHRIQNIPAVLKPAFVKHLRFSPENEYRFSYSYFGSPVKNDHFYATLEQLGDLEIFTNNVDLVHQVISGWNFHKQCLTIRPLEYLTFENGIK